MDFVLDLRVKNYIVALVAQSMPVGSGVFDAFFLEISREQFLYQLPSIPLYISKKVVLFTPHYLCQKYIIRKI